MQLQIRQRVFAWGDTYDVYDESGQPRYIVRSEILALGHQIHVCRADTGEEIGAIHQRLLTLLPKFDIEIGGETEGTVNRELSLFYPRYTVDFKDWDVQGDVFAWNYSVCHRGMEVMSIRKEWLAWGDTYVMEYANPAFEIPGLMIVLAIDAANCDD